MTPTRAGRWQTRLFLLGTVGALATALFGLLFGDWRTPFALLGYVLLAGFAWDALYDVLQGFRWDHDWPPAYQLAAGVAEGGAIWLLHALVGLPGVADGLAPGRFLAHYGAVWLLTFLCSQGPMRLLFPRWRFNGGELF
ncbi:MAG TPA: hypothetical protein VGE07_18045 [Herpetosiphonaceae bacterium]